MRASADGVMVELLESGQVHNVVTGETCELIENICMQVRKQQLELAMEQQTGSKWGKEYVRLYIVTLPI